MSEPGEDKAVLQLRRVIAAPRERVFAAWTTPSDIKAWFGPDNCRVLDAHGHGWNETLGKLERYLAK
jgi:hypothetical protein